MSYFDEIQPAASNDFSTDSYSSASNESFESADSASSN